MLSSFFLHIINDFLFKDKVKFSLGFRKRIQSLEPGSRFMGNLFVSQARLQGFMYLIAVHYSVGCSSARV